MYWLPVFPQRDLSGDDYSDDSNSIAYISNAIISKNRHYFKGVLSRQDNLSFPLPIRSVPKNANNHEEGFSSTIPNINTIPFKIKNILISVDLSLVDKMYWASIRLPALQPSP